MTLLLNPVSLEDYRTQAGSDWSLLTQPGSRTMRLAADHVLRADNISAADIDPGVADASAEWRVRDPSTRQTRSPSAFLARLENALVFRNGFVVGTSDNYWVTDSVRTTALIPRLGHNLVAGNKIAVSATITEGEGPVIVLGAQTNANYFHWLFESLTRVGLAQLCGLLENARLLVPEMTPMHLDALAMAGIAPDRLVVLNHDVVRFPVVYLPSRGLGRIHDVSVLGSTYLRSLAEGLSGVAASPPRLFASRAKSRRRRLDDEGAISAVFADHGFEVVDPGELRVQEQAGLFAGAEVIAGPHGAGLANTVFAPGASLLIELSPEGQDFSGTAIYRSVAAARGQTYACLVGPSLAPLARRGDFAIDPRRLEALLGRLLND